MLNFIQFFHKYFAYFPLLTFISNEINAEIFVYCQQHSISKEHFFVGGFYSANYFVCMFSYVLTFYFVIIAWTAITMIGILFFRPNFRINKLALIFFIISSILFYLRQKEYGYYY